MHILRYDILEYYIQWIWYFKVTYLTRYAMLYLVCKMNNIYIYIYFNV